MPLTILYGYSILDHMNEVSVTFVIIWAIGLTSFIITTLWTGTWWLRNDVAVGQYLKEKSLPSPTIEMQQVKIINVYPFFISGSALAGLFYPAQMLNLQLIIAIGAAVNMICMVNYCMAILGDSDMPKRLLTLTPKKKWWAHSYCGGVNDMLPALALLYSKEPHKLKSQDLNRAWTLLQGFAFFFIVTASIQAGINAAPTTIYQPEKDSWCYATDLWPTSSFFLGLVNVFSTFVGAAGYAIITKGVIESLRVFDSNMLDSLKLEAKATSAGLYLALPLLNFVITLIPLQVKKFKIGVPQTLTAEKLAGGNFTTSGITLNCPVYDHSVCVPTIYCLLVTMIMAYMSVSNSRNYKFADVSHQTLRGECLDLTQSEFFTRYPSACEKDDSSDEWSSDDN